MNRVRSPAAFLAAVLLAARVLAALLLPALAAGGAAAQQGLTLPYLNAPPDGAPIRRPPTLGLSVGGEIHRAVMDTGSTGVVVSATSIAGFEALPQLGPGELTYSSSGRIMRGVYVETPVTLTGADGTSLTTRPIRVLAVTRIDCLKRARSCRPQEAPRRVAMLGIGFARSRDHQPGATPERNPFLNLPGMGTPGQPGALGRGYVVRRQSVTVGLSAGDAQGFSQVKLTADPQTGDWAATPVCLSLAGRTPAACGTLLMDTGVTTMFLSLPLAQTDGLAIRSARGAPVVANGTRLAVSPGPGATAPAYAFTVGDASDPVVPQAAMLVGRGRRPIFVNTTVRALNAFDYLFDADAGAVGFRPHAP
ncbi:hypothetical protein V5F40_17010 [Xanthobacter sp. DSM 14520]|uniref:hypothetical protein n=1 Tax=Xanthobacter autotrophicus (strain ATCC BAA-1158 / Py2) TaxID=78245 RepID=UPI00372BF684